MTGRSSRTEAAAGGQERRSHRYAFDPSAGLRRSEVLKITEAARPVPLPTEMLIRVRAVGVNPVEAVIRSGQFPLLGQPPFVLGWDVCGVVEEVEPGVTRFQPGDEVYGMPFFPRAASAYAEYVAAPSRQLARKPAGLSHAEAAALPLASLTAWQALVDTAQVAAGRRFAGLSVGPDYPALEALAGLAESGKLRVHLQATLGLAEAAKAHELLESGSVTGKIALTL
jgi:NADPH:quinone reductase-like Zn-dependent oxidoreductase